MARASVLNQKSLKTIKAEKKAAKRAKFASGVDKFIGDEPLPQVYESEGVLATSYNWYNYNYGSKDGIPWIVEYMKANGYSSAEISAFRAAPDWKPGITLGAFCRMVNIGSTLPEYSYQWAKRKIQEVIEYQRPKTSSVQTSSITIADRIKDKVSNMIGDFEEQIDMFVENGFKSDFDAFEYMKKNDVKAAQAAKVSDFYSPLKAELEAALAGKDSQLKEGYSKLTKAQMKALLDFVSSFVKGSNTAAVIKKTVRKPRKVKVKSADQLTNKMKYLKESGTYKIASIDPTRILKAKGLVVFNTKYRKLGIYIAATEEGLSVKGTTIQNFSEEQSFSKGVRKPEAVLPSILSQPKMGIIKTFNNIKSTQSVLNGRINEDTILVKVF